MLQFDNKFNGVYIAEKHFYHEKISIYVPMLYVR